MMEKGSQFAKTALNIIGEMLTITEGAPELDIVEPKGKKEMNAPITIEPDIQEAILDILPDSGPRALDVMAQLTANMIIEIKGANINDYVENLKKHLALYEGT